MSRLPDDHGRHATAPAESRCGTCGRTWTRSDTWSGCPGRAAHERGEYALQCRQCGTAFFDRELGTPCPECHSDGTIVRGRPDDHSA